MVFMAALLVPAHFVGSAIRFNIRYFEPIENFGHGPTHEIAFASRAFALFYALQGGVAFLVARQTPDLPRRKWQLATFAVVTVLCLLVFGFGVSSE